MLILNGHFFGKNISLKRSTKKAEVGPVLKKRESNRANDRRRESKATSVVILNNQDYSFRTFYYSFVFNTHTNFDKTNNYNPNFGKEKHKDGKHKGMVQNFMKCQRQSHSLKVEIVRNRISPPCQTTLDVIMNKVVSASATI